jgi:putative ABC transport system permease protein
VTDALFLAWRSLAGSRGRTAVLVFGLAVSLFLPLFTWQVGSLAEDRLLARARSTPVVIGRKGDRYDLVFGAVYFRGDVREPVTEADLRRFEARDGLSVVPVHLGHAASGVPVVGTTLAYLERRGLSVADGRAPAVLGEVVVGAGIASSRGIGVGDQLRSDVRNPYDVSAAFPLLLQVVGVLEATGGADDDVLIADLKTAWVMDGLLHGHGGGEVLAEDADNVALAPSLFFHTEIDADNLGAFHLHGGPETRPVSAILAFPDDARAHDTLLGVLEVDARLQGVRPEPVVRGVLGIVLQVQAWLSGAIGLVWAATLALVATIVSLSLRLRAAELTLLRRLGASPTRVAAMVGVELVLVCAAAALLAAAGCVSALRLLELAIG